MTDKELGAIWGQATGDVQGLSALNSDQATKVCPTDDQCCADHTQNECRKDYQAGQWSDNTDIMFCLTRKADGDFDEKQSVLNLLNWLKSDVRGLENQTFEVLSTPQYKLYPPGAAEAFWRRSDYTAATNGALVRTSILSVWYIDKSIVYLASQSEKLCRITHPDPRCVGSCVVFNYVLWLLIRGYSVSRADLISLARTYDERIEQYINLAFDNADIAALDLSNIDERSNTLKTLSVALWALVYGGSYQNGLQAVLEQGGDVVANGAVVGAILGARFGCSAIPKSWRDKLYEQTRLESVNK